GQRRNHGRQAGNQDRNRAGKQSPATLASQTSTYRVNQLSLLPWVGEGPSVGSHEVLGSMCADDLLSGIISLATSQSTGTPAQASPEPLPVREGDQNFLFTYFC